jgi:hypothetical protein
LHLALGLLPDALWFQSVGSASTARIHHAWMLANAVGPLLNEMGDSDSADHQSNRAKHLNRVCENAIVGQIADTEIAQPP